MGRTISISGGITLKAVLLVVSIGAIAIAAYVFGSSSKSSDVTKRLTTPGAILTLEVAPNMVSKGNTFTVTAKVHTDPEFVAEEARAHDVHAQDYDHKWMEMFLSAGSAQISPAATSGAFSLRPTLTSASPNVDDGFQQWRVQPGALGRQQVRVTVRTWWQMSNDYVSRKHDALIDEASFDVTDGPWTHEQIIKMVSAVAGALGGGGVLASIVGSRKPKAGGAAR